MPENVESVARDGEAGAGPPSEPGAELTDDAKFTEADSGILPTAMAGDAEHGDTDTAVDPSREMQVDVDTVDGARAGDVGAEAASPTIDVVGTQKKLATLKSVRSIKRHSTNDWNPGISIAQIPEDLKMLNSGDLSVLESTALEDDQATQSNLGVNETTNSETVSESSSRTGTAGLKRRMRRLTSFNRAEQIKAKKERRPRNGMHRTREEEEEIEGPHRAPRIAHSLLHGKPTHVPAMYAAEGLDLLSRTSMADLSTAGADRKKAGEEDILREQFIHLCEEVLDTPPLSRASEKLRQLCTLAKVNSFTIGGSDVPDYIALECWRYVSLQRVLPSSTLMKQGDDASFMCFILEGLMDVFINGLQVNTTGFGTAVGEVALMQEPVGKRSATLIARGPVLVARLDWVHYHRILKSEHAAANDNRTARLAQFPLFRDWPAASLLRVSRLLEYTEYKRGDAVLLQGCKNTKVFIVATGLVGIVMHITSSPSLDVAQKYVDRWLRATQNNTSKEEESRSVPLQNFARRLNRKTVEVARLGPGHHFSNVTRTSEDPRKIPLRWDSKTREQKRASDLGGLGELAAAIHPDDLAPFTVVCHTDCVLYRLDMSKLHELQTSDIVLLRSFYETSPQIPDKAYIHDLIHQQSHWNEYKTGLVNEIVETRARRNVHGDMIAGELHVSRRSRASSNLNATTALQIASSIDELAIMGPSPTGSTRGPSRNISQPPTKTSILREYRASQQRLSSTSLPELSRRSNQSISMSEPYGQGYLPSESSASPFEKSQQGRRRRGGDSVSIDAVTAKGGRHEAQLGSSASSYCRWLKTKQMAAKRGASLRVPTPKLKSGNGVARERAIHKIGTDSGLAHRRPGSLDQMDSAVDHLKALVLERRDKLQEAKRGAGIYGDTLWEKHEDLVPTDNMEPLEKAKGWNAVRKAGAPRLKDSLPHPPLLLCTWSRNLWLSTLIFTPTLLLCSTVVVASGFAVYSTARQR